MAKGLLFDLFDKVCDLIGWSNRKRQIDTADDYDSQFSAAKRARIDIEPDSPYFENSGSTMSGTGKSFSEIYKFKDMIHKPDDRSKRDVAPVESSSGVAKASLFSSMAGFVGGPVKDVRVSTAATAHSVNVDSSVLHKLQDTSLWECEPELRRPALRASADFKRKHSSLKPKPSGVTKQHSSFSSGRMCISTDLSGRKSGRRRQLNIVNQCVQLADKEKFKQLLELHSDTVIQRPLTPVPDRRTHLSVNKSSAVSDVASVASTDCFIIGFEGPVDALGKRVNDYSSLLSSLVTSTASKTDTCPCRGVRVSSRTPKISAASSVSRIREAFHPAESSMFRQQSASESPISTESNRVHNTFTSVSKSAGASSPLHHVLKENIGTVSGACHFERNEDNAVGGDIAGTSNDKFTTPLKDITSKISERTPGDLRSPKTAEWERTLNESKYTKHEFLDTLLRDREIAERRRIVLSQETKVNYLKEKRIKDEEQLITRINNTLFLTERIPIPIEEPLYTVESSEEEEEEEEVADEFPDLSDDQEAAINRALKPGPPDQVLVEGFKLQICRRDIATLGGLNWLNDEVINFYMNLLMERGGQNGLPRVYSFNTFFYPKLMNGGHASVKRWTKQVDLFSYDFILIPVHLGMHWCLAVVDLQHKEIRYYDSMGGRNEKCLDALQKYLDRESQEKRKSDFDFTGWKFFAVQDIPQQMNGSDCGMFTCKFAEYIVRNARITFDQSHMPYFRRRMVYEIISKQLL